ncbi:hypothetical protein ACFE04_024431 [Oxalis oulophora]
MENNSTKLCPNCCYIIDNSDGPSLPIGVKFDPTDKEIIWHFLTKVGFGDLKQHPFIDEFIPTVKNASGICYAHPQDLADVKQEGTVSHFFHRVIKAYNTRTRKCRTIHDDDSGDVCWHKIGRTKHISLDGTQKGCKKIMVIYITRARGSKPEKTNWVMHQYQLGIREDEKQGDYIISKIFFQQQAKEDQKIAARLANTMATSLIVRLVQGHIFQGKEPPQGLWLISGTVMKRVGSIYAQKLMSENPKHQSINVK